MMRSSSRRTAMRTMYVKVEFGCWRGRGRRVEPQGGIAANCSWTVFVPALTCKPVEESCDPRTTMQGWPLG